MIGAYTLGSIVAVLVALAADLLVARTGLVRTRLFWASYAIMLFFQMIVNGLLTGLGVVQYDPAVITGIRIAFAPIEDIGFGFGLILLTLVGWVRVDRSRADGPATARRSGSDVTRSES